ncbi:MAG: cupin-like domain-containing protein [Chloroflexota bacterium]
MLTDTMQEWPATKKWSLPFFKTLVPEDPSMYAEVGDIVLDPSSRFQQVEFGKYVDDLMAGKGTRDSKHIAYLADFNIFQNFPALQEDVDFGLITSNTVKTRINGWIGPENTVASYHADLADNLFAQVQGRKLVKLVSPKHNRMMYPSKKFDAGSVLSSVDADDYDAGQYPLFDESKSQYTVLGPGELLYIPYGWWHYIRALDPSISINCFG